jgi:ZIP family zinc transporter
MWCTPASTPLVSRIIPETHRRDHQNQATLGLMIGFVLMMYLDVMLG